MVVNDEDSDPRDVSRIFETRRRDGLLVRWAGEVLGERLPDRIHGIACEQYIEGATAGTANETFELGGSGADRRQPDRPSKAA